MNKNKKIILSLLSFWFILVTIASIKILLVDFTQTPVKTENINIVEITENSTEETSINSTKIPITSVVTTTTTIPTTIETTVTKSVESRVNLEDYEYEIEMIAKVIYCEARGVNSIEEQAAVAWCILNRVDSSEFPNSISSVITQPDQFAWAPDTYVIDDFKKIAEDVIKIWLLEKNGKAPAVGRILPRTYLYFYGNGEENFFRETYEPGPAWDWSLPSPY